MHIVVLRLCKFGLDFNNKLVNEIDLDYLEEEIIN